MKSISLFLRILTLIYIGFFDSAFAQNKADVSTFHLNEVKRFYQECTTNSEFKNIYDCRCLAIQYLDAIKASGSYPYNRQAVINNLDKTSCPWTDASLERKQDIPQAYLDEAQSFYESCGTHIVYGSYYDCECLSSHYLDERIKLGRFADASLIKMNIAKTCASETATAGHAYKECMEHKLNVPAKLEIENYCSCVANEYAKMYVNSQQSFSPSLLIALQTESALRCRKKL